MKNILRIALFCVVATLSLASCDDPQYPDFTGGDDKGEGTLSMSSLKVEVINAEDVIESRSSQVNVGGYTVNIKKKLDNSLVKTWTYSEMPEIVTLGVGEYILEVFNSPVVDAAWDSPYYYATKDFTIVKNDVTDLGVITCKLQNVKVSVKYTEALMAAIGKGDDVNVNVVVGETGSLDFAYGELRSGFFRYVPSSTTLVATFSGTVEGYYMNEFKVVTDVAPGQHRIITFSIKEGPTPPEAQGNIGQTNLTLDFTVSTEDLTIDVPVTEDPVQPDDMLELSDSKLMFADAASSKTIKVNATESWTASCMQDWVSVSPNAGVKGESSVEISVLENTTDSPRTATVTFVMGSITRELIVSQSAKADESAPQISSPTLDLSQVHEVTEGIEAKVHVDAVNGIKNLFVTINSVTLTPEELENVGLKQNFDLANPGDLSEALSGLQFPVGDAVTGKTSLDFDVSAFIPLLPALGPGKSDFVIRVVDMTGQETEATLQFVVK